jgi:Platelet-activating factor acetylhydrolase, isoform II
MNRKTNAVADLPAVAVSRRRLLGGAAALASGLAVTPWAGTALAAEQTARLRLTLPAPTGPYPIGTVPLHLVDHARQDPWWSTPHPRELMVNVWYPARDVGPWPLAPWMSPGALAYFRTELEEFLSFSPDTTPGQPPSGTPVSLDGVDFPTTHARQGAPVARSTRPYPAVLFSPGYSFDREMGTTLVEDLASHGYVVVTMSNTYEAWEVEFPGGRIERGRHDPDNDLSRDPYDALKIRLADTRFVLDQLAALNAGHNPDAERRPLPAGLRQCLDLARIGVFGHSLGGALAAHSIALDTRVTAAVNLDGSMFPYDLSPLPPTTPEQLDQALVRLADRIGNRPFMIMGDSGWGPDQFGNLTSVVWHHLRGWRRFVSLVGSTHGTYTDHEPFLNQLAAAGIIESAAPWVGTIPLGRAVAAERAYIRAFFDLWLRDRDSHLLDGPSVTYPEANIWL